MSAPTTHQTYNSIVVLTGAGVSAESGLKTFRDNNGLWENHRVADVCTPEAFNTNPTLVQRFYNTRRQQLVSEVRPNAAHLALAKFESQFSGNFLLVTQNVDNLHELGGSKNCLHMHGELLKARCLTTETIHAWTQDITQTTPCPCCNKAGNLRPHIVWFGEMPLYMQQISQALAQCDLFIAIGTSGNVYPAAGFVSLAKEAGAHTVEINLEPSLVESHFHECIYGAASKTVDRFLMQLV